MSAPADYHDGLRPEVSNVDDIADLGQADERALNLDAQPPLLPYLVNL